MTRLHFTLVRIWLVVAAFTLHVGCKTLYPEALKSAMQCRTGTGMTAQTNCEELYATEAASLQALTDAGLVHDGNTALLNGVELRIHPESDGYRFNKVTLPDGGIWGETGNSGAACALHPMPRFMYLATDAWSTTPLCHEMGHILLNRAQVGQRTGECLSPVDHDIFRALNLDTKCGAAVQPVKRRFQR